MNGSTAFYLKQIMTAEHLSLTQAAKAIGISQSSMRKVLKDAKMSQPIMFKINRFIDAHEAIVKTKPGEPPVATKTKPARKTTTKAAKKAAPTPPAKTNEAVSTTETRFTIHQADDAPVHGGPDHPESDAVAPTGTPLHATREQEMEARASKLAEAGVGSLEANPTQPPHDAPGPATPALSSQVVTVQEAQVAIAAPQASASQTEPAPEDTTESPVAPDAEATPKTDPTTQAGAVPAPDAAEATATAPEPRSIKPIVVPEDRTTATLQFFLDESFVRSNDWQRNMLIGVTVIDPDDEQALNQFEDTLYPFGWQPGDEVKARGKNHDQIAAMLTHAHSETARNFVVFSPQSDTGNFSLSFGVFYPYLAAILRILNATTRLPDKVRITLDRRGEIDGDQLGVAARMLNSYVKAQSGKDVMFLMRTSDSKSEIGIQYSDFVAHAALSFSAEELAACGVDRLADLGSELGDQITLFSMIGLQKYLLDDHTASGAKVSFKNPVLVAAERLFRLASKAATFSQVPDETLTQAKLVLNQLLQITPSAVNGAINKMPFQNWYDMIARASAILHYTDETLPEFDIDQDALQIAQDALNNITNLLASAR